MKVIIIEDEAPAREIVKTFLKSHSDIELCAEYSDGFAGIKGIKEFEPDLVFLDVQMPKITGFEMLELMDKHPEIIFTTAYDQYAIKAFEMNAIDYLLKPFAKDRFDQALNKARTKLATYTKEETAASSAHKVIETMDAKADTIFRIVVKKGGDIHVIPVENLLYIEAQDDYVMLYTEKSKYLKEKTMKYYESHLDEKQFVRVHRSYIVRIDAVKRLEPYGKSSYIAVLSNGQKANVSLSGYKKLKEVLNF
ncbi:MAG: LytTR family DNA-binding domain-containing protein [Salinivirgaceae bacterium]|jgi:two-component system LytT family response regulator|nr:LytTR family DNA-binding domain-containing protein [Salinivirgaceae bacterium]